MDSYLRKFGQGRLLPKASFSTSFSAIGNPEGLPIVFIHGIRLGRHIWDDHVQLLREDFKVITLDLPGHGTLAHAQLTQENVNRQLLYIVESIVGRPPVLVGYSLGGLLAINFVERYPEHTAGLLLAGATLDVTGWKRTIYDLAITPAFRLPGTVCTRMLAGLFRLTLPREVAKTIISTPFNYDVFKQSHALISGTPFSARLRGYSKPALFITGEFDPIFRPGQAHFARQCGARSRVVRGTDHVLPLRRPNQFCEVVRNFCATLKTQ